jgi:Na+/H+-dicarboxylate symporter
MKNKQTLLTVGIVVGLLLGMVVGEIVFRASYDPATQTANPPAALLQVFQFLGDTFFIGLLKMILVPLIASSVIVGVASIDPAHLGRLGGLTMFYYLSTMVAAVVLGVVLVTAIQPGHDFPESFRDNRVQQFQQEGGVLKDRAEKAGEMGRKGVVGALWDCFRQIAGQMIPSNPIGAAANGEMLPVISFSLIFGIVLSVIGPAGKPVLDFFQSLYTAVMTLVDWILWLAPLGVFFLVAWSVAKIGSLGLIGPLGLYMVTVVAGLAIHGLIVLPLALWVFGRCNPYRYMHQVRQALMTAFGTASSSATLPVSMESCEQLGGVSRKASSFVLPLGATINMDGTALYEAVAVVFLFQCFGIELGGTQLAIIVITATLAAIGAAGIPSAGLVTMVIVVESVNNSLGASVPNLPLASVGIILGVDRVLDMCRTTVNVWGDLVGAKIITRVAPDGEAAHA